LQQGSARPITARGYLLLWIVLPSEGLINEV
jgi:hypothetical protein